MKSAFDITSESIGDEITNIDEFVRKQLIPQYKQEVLNFYENFFKERFEHVVLNYDGTNKIVSSYFPKEAKIETKITFDEKPNELSFSIEGTTDLFNLILDKQNKGTASGIVSKDELDFFLKDDVDIKRTPRKLPQNKDATLYMDDLYGEKNYYYEPTFNDIIFAQRVDSLLEKIIDNFGE